MLLRQSVASITCHPASLVDWSALLIDLWRHLDGSCPSWVKMRIPAASKCFPLCPHKRTSTGTNVVSEKCQKETKPSRLGPRLARHFVGATVGWKSYAPMPSSVRHAGRLCNSLWRVICCRKKWALPMLCLIRSKLGFFLRCLAMGRLPSPFASLPNLCQALLQALKLQTNLRLHGVLQCDRAPAGQFCGGLSV